MLIVLNIGDLIFLLNTYGGCALVLSNSETFGFNQK